MLSLFMQTTKHEEQGMICYTACSVMASKVLKGFNKDSLLIEMQMLSDILSNMKQHTGSLSDTVCTLTHGY
jgi:hypothetical protein